MNTQLKENTLKTINLHNETIQASSLDDLNESQKQELAEITLKHFNVYLMNTEVEYILSKSYEDPGAPFSWDDCENWTYSGQVEINGAWYELDEEERDEKLEFYEYLRDKASNILDHVLDNEDKYNDEKTDKIERLFNKYEDIISELESMSFDDAPEVFQWFLCPELCYHLKQHGQVVLNGEYWGRQCYGQAIILDNVIQQIAFDLNWT